MNERELDLALDRLGVEHVRRTAPSILRDRVHVVPLEIKRRSRWRFQSMLSATKFVVAGAIVALFGGLLVVAQPFDRQSARTPGAATGEDRPAIEAVTGQFDSVVPVGGPDARFGTSPDGNDFFRDEVFAGGAEMSDERLSGKVTITANDDYSGTGGDVGDVILNWGTVSIENDAGAWLGTHKWLMAGDGLLGPIFMELVGSGAYEGWSAILYASEVPIDNSGAAGSPVYGAVFSGNLPPDRESYLD